jgi:hypothetical protein
VGAPPRAGRAIALSRMLGRVLRLTAPWEGRAAHSCGGDPRPLERKAHVGVTQMTESEKVEQPVDAAATENRSLFIEAVADPIKRRIAFDVVDRNCRMRFRVGEEGIRAYLEVLDLVQSSKVDEALDEFEKRFLPMLDQKALKKMAEPIPPEQ